MRDLPREFIPLFQNQRVLGDPDRADAGVWLVTSQQYPAGAVLKIKHPASALQDALAEVLQTKGQVTDRLVVPLERGFSGIWHYDVTPYFPQGALEPHIDSLDEEGRMTLVADMNTALKALHTRDSSLHRGIIHGDVKPSNILVTRKGGAWRFALTDFDSATLFDSDGVSRRRYTPKYAAPEVHGFHRIYRASDYWSLGMVMLRI